MNHVVRMHRLERGGHAFGDAEPLAQGEPIALLVFQVAVQRAELAPLGDLEELVVFLDELELQDEQQVGVRADLRDRLGRPPDHRAPLLLHLVGAALVEAPRCGCGSAWDRRRVGAWRARYSPVARRRRGCP